MSDKKVCVVGTGTVVGNSARIIEEIDKYGKRIS